MVRYSENSINKIKSVPVSQIIGKVIELKKIDGEQKALCPFHVENTPSFSALDHKGVYHCFGCGSHGDAIQFLMNYFDLGYISAIEKASEISGLPLEIEASTPEEKKRYSSIAESHDILEFASAWFQKQLMAESGIQARDILDKRNVSTDAISEFMIGFAPDSSWPLITLLEKKGFTKDQMVSAGLMIKSKKTGKPYPAFKNRIMFPFLDMRGKVISFCGRSLRAEDMPKYKNGPESHIFSKKDEVFGLRQASRSIREYDSLNLVEGPFDIIASWQAGHKNTVAPLGTAITEGQLNACWALQKNVLILLDGDIAGKKAGMRVVERHINLISSTKNLWFAQMPEGNDPDEFLQNHSAEEFQDILDHRQSLLDFTFGFVTAGKNALPAEQLQAFEELGAIAGKIENELLSDIYLDAFASKWQNWRATGINTATVMHNVQQEKAVRAMIASIIATPELARDSIPDISTVGNPTLRGLLAEICLQVISRENITSSEIEEYINDLHGGNILHGMTGEEALGKLEKLGLYKGADPLHKWKQLVARVEQPVAV